MGRRGTSLWRQAPPLEDGAGGAQGRERQVGRSAPADRALGGTAPGCGRATFVPSGHFLASSRTTSATALPLGSVVAPRARWREVGPLPPHLASPLLYAPTPAPADEGFAGVGGPRSAHVLVERLSHTTSKLSPRTHIMDPNVYADSIAQRPAGAERLRITTCIH